MVESVSPVTLPVMLQGRYRMGAIIGRGGASAVYRARDLLLGRDVAIKVFTTRAVDAEDLRTQEGEARMLAGFNHPGLVTLLDAGVDLTDPAAPQVFLVMELRRTPTSASGSGAVRWTRSRSPTSAGTCSTRSHYVHERGIIHRDLKPANVLLVEARDRPARGKLADFGIAVLRGHSQERDAETTTGTAAYLSPEQVEGGAISPATDIYSLGLVLLEAYSGRVAYPGRRARVRVRPARRGPGDPEPRCPPTSPTVLRRMTAREARPIARPRRRRSPTFRADHHAAPRRRTAAGAGPGGRPPRRGPGLQPDRHTARRRVRPDHRARGAPLRGPGRGDQHRRREPGVAEVPARHRGGRGGARPAASAPAAACRSRPSSSRTSTTDPRTASLPDTGDRRTGSTRACR